MEKLLYGIGKSQSMYWSKSCTVEWWLAVSPHRKNPSWNLCEWNFHVSLVHVQVFSRSPGFLPQSRNVLPKGWLVSLNCPQVCVRLCGWLATCSWCTPLLPNSGPAGSKGNSADSDNRWMFWSLQKTLIIPSLVKTRNAAVMQKMPSARM